MYCVCESTLKTNSQVSYTWHLLSLADVIKINTSQTFRKVQPSSSSFLFCFLMCAMGEMQQRGLSAIILHLEGLSQRQPPSFPLISFSFF